MFYTITLNPSVDYFVRLKSFRKGITNRTDSEEYYIGGKGINVSCVLSELGIESTVLGFIAGMTGAAIEQGLKDKGIASDFIRRDQRTRTADQRRSVCRAAPKGGKHLGRRHTGLGRRNPEHAFE